MMKLPKAAKYLITTVCIASFTVNLVIKSRTTGDKVVVTNLLVSYWMNINQNVIVMTLLSKELDSRLFI